MKAPMVNTALERQLLGQRDPRHPIAASAFGLHGSLSSPSSSTDILMSALADEPQNDSPRILPFDYFVKKITG